MSLVLEAQMRGHHVRVALRHPLLYKNYIIAASYADYHDSAFHFCPCYNRVHGNVVGNDILPVSRCYMYMFTAHYKADLITSSRNPLFAFTPIQSGGLGLSEAKIGVHMTIRSLNQIIVMSSFAPLYK